jgi:hypothetical protein
MQEFSPVHYQYTGICCEMGRMGTHEAGGKPFVLPDNSMILKFNESTGLAVHVTYAPAAPDTGFPLATAALIAVGGIGLIGGGVLVRRWYIRRQNPALFREYD